MLLCRFAAPRPSLQVLVLLSPSKLAPRRNDVESMSVICDWIFPAPCYWDVVLRVVKGKIMQIVSCRPGEHRMNIRFGNTIALDAGLNLTTNAGYHVSE